ncbi:MAG: oxygenase MpaB family protein [Verrucomicrobiota bacterium]
MESLEIEFSQRVMVTTIALAGRLDGNSCGAFADSLDENLKAKDKFVIVDARELVAVSSAGLRELLKLVKRLSVHKTKPAIAGMNTPVALALEISGFDSLFHRAADVDAAMECFDFGEVEQDPSVEVDPGQGPAMVEGIPSEYPEGYTRSWRIEPVWSERYVRHTIIGDPEADALIRALQGETEERKQVLIQAGIEGGVDAIPDAPDEVRDFFSSIEKVPEWFDPNATEPGCRAFHLNSQMFIGAFVGAVLIEGFTTLISKSFSITGRVVDQGVRRLKQNNRHITEIFMPSGLDRHGDGWKLSVRVRLIHAQVRHLLAQSEDWNEEAWGTPLSAAHIGYATASFSGLLLKRAEKLGVYLNAEEEESFMMIWRYSGHLMGVPDEMLFTDKNEALLIHDVGTWCEPSPSLESCQLANALINAAPVVAGIEEEQARRQLVKKLYQVSRALIGDRMADSLNFPSSRSVGVLALLRGKNRWDKWLASVFPTLARRQSVDQFQQMLELSHYEERGIAYRMPGHVHAEKDKPL